jgi:tetratricopeptide (TPR) repeat protein
MIGMPLWAQDGKPAVNPPAATAQEQAPPEEDENLRPKDYAFNPLQATKEMTTGEFYMHKGKFQAAANRFREATRWNPTLPEAFLKLGEAEEKNHDKRAAKEAYQHYLELAPDGRLAKDVQHKMSKL